MLDSKRQAPARAGREVETMRSQQITTAFIIWIWGAAAGAAADVWGVKTHDPVSQPPTTLFRISADGETCTEYGYLRSAEGDVEVDGLALDAQQALYGFQLGSFGSRLVAIEPATVEVAALGPDLTGRGIRGAAFVSGSRLLVLDAQSDELLEITVPAGIPAGPGIPLTLDAAPYDVHTMVDLVEVAPGSLVVVQFNEFFALDAGTGALTRLHRDDLVASDGLGVGIAGAAWLPAAAGGPRLVAYDVQQDDDVFAYDPAQSYQRSDLHLRIVPGYNAGRGDLASRPAHVAGADDRLPKQVFLSLTAQPNPFNPRVTITFALSEQREVALTIHDVSGRQVRQLALAVYADGLHAVAWDGCDDDGRPVPAGVYICRAGSGAQVAWRRLTLVK